MSGRSLWIQDYVKNKEICLCPVGTVHNLGDVATKPFSGHRLRALLRCMGMVHGDRQQPVGEAEHNRSVEGALTSSQVSRLAKTILRMTVLMGLESGAAGLDFEAGACPNDMLELPPTEVTKWMFWGLVFMLMAAGALLIFVLVRCMIYYDRVLTNLSARLNRWRDGAYEDIQAREREIAMTTNYAEALRFGLVRNGGFCVGQELTPGQREQMRLIEDSNIARFHAEQQRIRNEAAPY